MRKIITKLNDLNVEYALTGALAVSYYGRPRTTVDVDVIIKIDPTQFERLAKAFNEAGLVCSVQQLVTAWESKYRIASLEGKKGLRLDAILTQEDIPRRKVNILGRPSYLQEPGPLVLQKLRLIKVTQDEERKFVDKMDVLSILRNAEVDLDNLRTQAGEQATLDILDELLTQAEEPV